MLEPLAALVQLKEVALVVRRAGEHKARRQPEVLEVCRELRERMAGNTALTVTFAV